LLLDLLDLRVDAKGLENLLDGGLVFGVVLVVVFKQVGQLRVVHKQGVVQIGEPVQGDVESLMLGDF